MIHPRFLKPNDKVVILSPSGKIESQWVEGLKEVLESYGLIVSVGEHALCGNGRFAGTDEERIKGFSQAGAIVTGHTLGEGMHAKEKAQNQGWAFLGLGIVFGLIAAGIVLIISGPIIRAYNLSEETASIAAELMLSISIIIVFQASNSIMTKGVLRGGGDTKVLMIADNVFLWVASIPLGILAGLVFHLPAFWIYFFLKIDQVLKAVWCVIRLSSGKWIKKIKSSTEL